MSSSDTSNSTKSDMEKAKAMIAEAISNGAPAYNAGDIEGCARIYKSTGGKIAKLGLLPLSFKTSLEKVVQCTESDDNEIAWAFRRQFDAIMDYQIPFMPDDGGANKWTLEKFSDTVISSQPMNINDNVMGGISQGQWVKDASVFTGNTSLANNGGFASLRWRMDRVQNWSYAQGIYLKVKHSNPENHTFRLILKDFTCEEVRGANYKNIFGNPLSNTMSEDQNPIFIPFSAFDKIESMGQKLGGPPFNRSSVTEIGIMAIKPSIIGEFELKIKEWGLYY